MKFSSEINAGAGGESHWSEKETLCGVCGGVGIHGVSDSPSMRMTRDAWRAT